MALDKVVKFFVDIYEVYKASETAQAIYTAFTIITAVVGVKGFLQARQMMSKGQDILANKTAAGGKIPVIYGTRRVGTQIVYMDTAQNRSRDLFVVYALAVGECDEIIPNSIEIDGNSIYDGNIYKGGGYVGSDRYGQTGYSNHRPLNTASQVGDNQYSSAGNLGTNPALRYSFVFNLHHGASSQTVDPMLSASIGSQWTTAHKLNGICYIAASFDYDKKGMYKGVPQITVQVRGKRVFDPRDNSTKWSSNPALCFLDYIQNDEYGKGLATSQINMTAIGTAADKCDTLVDQPYYNGSYQSFTWSGDTGNDYILINDNDDWWQNKIDEVVDIKDSDGNLVIDEKDIKDSSRYEFYDQTQENRLYIDDTLQEDYTNEAGTIRGRTKRFHCNGYIDTNKNVMDNAKELLANMRGIFTYIDGKYELQIEDTGTSTFSITDDHIIGDAGISVDYGNKDKRANKVVIEFFNANKKYELDTATVLHDASPEYYSDDGEILEVKAEFPYVTDPYIAYNMGKAILTRSRNQTTMQFLGTPEMYKLNVGDIVDLTYLPLNFNVKICRVEALELQANGLVAVSLIEYFDVYTWEVPAQEPTTIIAKPPTIGAIHPPEANSIVFTDTDASAINRPTLTWTEPTDFPVRQYRVDVVDSSDNNVFSKIVDTPSVDLAFLPKGSNYEASITSFNGVGIESNPSTKTFTIADDPVKTTEVEIGSETLSNIIDYGTIAGGGTSNFFQINTRLDLEDRFIWNSNGTNDWSLGTGGDDDVNLYIEGSADKLITFKDQSSELGSVKLTFGDDASGSYFADFITLEADWTNGYVTTGSGLSKFYIKGKGYDGSTASGTIATFQLTSADGYGIPLTELHGKTKTPILNLDQGTAPSTTTDLLYNVGGTLYWNGAVVDTGAGDITGVTINTSGGSLTGGASFASGDATFTLDIGTTIRGSKTFDDDVTFESNVVIEGNLDVQGTTTTIDTANLDVKDKNITLNYGTGDTSANANGAGITIQDAVSATQDATLTWNTANDSFNFSHNLNFADNVKAQFGSSALQIYSNGTNSYIAEGGTGDLLITTNGTGIRLQKNNGENMIKALTDGAVQLYYDNQDKLATTSSGINVTGTVTSDGLTVDGTSDLNGNVTIGTSLTTLFTGNDIEFQRAGDSYLSQTGGGALNIRTNDGTSNKVRLNLATNGDISFYDDTGTSQNLKWDASADSLNFVDNAKAQFGAGNDIQIYHNGITSNGNIENYKGGLFVTNYQDDGNIIFRSDDGSGGVAEYIVINGGNGSTMLKHYGSTKLVTTSTGIDVTGTVVADGLEARKDTGSTTNSLLKLTNSAGSTTDGVGITFEVANTSGAGGSVNVVRDGSNFKPYMTLNTSANISTAPSQRVRIDDTGINVTGTVTSDALTVSNGTNTTSIPTTSDRVAFTGASLNYVQSAGHLFIQPTGDLTLNGSGSEIMRLKDGKVGIGTTSPSFSLDVRTADNNVAQFKSTDASATVFIADNASSSAIRNNLGVLTLSADEGDTSSGTAIVFQTDTAERARITSNGNVGIGTSSPSEILTLDDTDPKLALRDAGIERAFLEVDSADNFVINNKSISSMIFETSDTERMRIDSSGNVGIGTTSPIYDFQIGSYGADSDSTLALASTTSGTGSIRFGDGTSGVQANAGKIAYDHSDNSMQFATNNGTERMRIDSTGGVGIGTTNPQAALHVAGGFNATAPTGNGVMMGYYLNSYGYIQLNGTSGGYIDFSTSGTDHKGRILYDNTYNYLRLDTNGSERMRLDSSGNLLVATTDTTLLNNTSGGGFSVSSNGFTQIAKQGVDNADPVLILNQTGVEGEILRFYKDGGIVGTITSKDGDMTIGTGDTGIRFYDGGNGVYPVNASTRAGLDATIDLGRSDSGGTFRFKDLYLSGTGYFGTNIAINAGNKIQLSGATDSTHHIYHDSSTDYDVVNYSTGFQLEHHASGTQFTLVGATGNVGIGTGAPNTNLHIYDGSGGATLKIESNLANAYDSSRIQLLGGNLSTSEILLGDASSATVGRIIYRHNGNSLAFDVNSSERLRIDSSGNVGIGTDSPFSSARLQVNTGTNLNLAVQTGTTDTSGMKINAFNDAGSANIPLEINGSVMLLKTGETERARITSSGNVGIGESNPQELLHLTATTPVFRMQGGSRIYQQYVSGTNFIIRDVTATANRITLDSSGNLLVGKTSSTGVATGNIEVSNSSSASVQIEGGTHEWSMLVSASSDALRFYQDSTERMRIDSSGKVGIGTSSPEAKLHVQDNTTVIGNGSSGYATINFHSATTGSARYGSIRKNYDSPYDMRIRASNSTNSVPLIFETASNAERMRIDSSGKLFLNSTSVTAGYTGAHLIVGGQTSPLIKLQSTHGTPSAWDIYTSSGTSLIFARNQSDKVAITSAGRLGVGTNSPSEKLHVLGNTKVTGNITVGASHTIGDDGQTDDFVIKSSEGNNLILKAGVDSDSLILKTTNTALTIDAEGLVTIEEETTINDDLTINATTPSLNLIDTNNNSDYAVNNANGVFQIFDKTNDVSRLSVTSAGNVGIGTNDPSNKLDIKGTVGFEATNSTNRWLAYTYTDNTFRLNYNGAGADEVVIDSSGNVGIGITSPADKLTVNGNIAIGGGKIFNGSADNSAGVSLPNSTVRIDGYNGITFHSSSTTVGSQTERMRLDSSGNLLVGKTSTSFGTDGVEIKNDQIWSTNTSSDCISLNRKTTDGAIATFYKDGSTGGVIGIQEPQDNAPELYIANGNGTYNTGLAFWNYISPTRRIAPCDGAGTYVDNAIDLGWSSARFDDIYATNGTIQTSDRNEKNTITDSDLGLDFIKRLSPKSYIYNDKTRTHYGLISQDVEEVLNDISKDTEDFAGFIKADVSEEQDGSEYKYGLRYTEFVAPLIKAIQEQQEQIELLKTEINNLKGE